MMSGRFITLRSPIVSCVLAITTIATIIPGVAAQQERPRRAVPLQQTPREALEQARSAPTSDERIANIEKFIAVNRGVAIEIEAREALMREYALRGEQRLRDGTPQQATSDFKAAFRAAPAEITDRVFSQYVFPMPVAMNSFGYRTESAELMRSFEGRFQNNVNRLIQIGFFYVQIEAPLEAVRTLERAVELAPQDSRGHNSLGSAYLINLRLDDAQAEYRRALELNPKDEYANLNLANLARSKGAMDRAIEYYQKQLAIKPDDGEAYGGLAIALLGAGRDEEAERALTKALELEPENYRLLTQLAFYYASRKKTIAARSAVERAAKIEQRYAWAHIAKANIDALESKFGDALATILPAQNLGAFPTLSFEVAKALIALDGYDQAIDVMNNTFKLTEDGEFEALLGGALKARSPKLDLLLERERQAALFTNEQLTTPFQYKLAESLLRIDHYLKVAAAAKSGKTARAAKPAVPRSQATRGRNPASRTARTRPSQADEPKEDLATITRPRRSSGADPNAELTAGADASLPGVNELMRAITAFATLDDGRQPFRMVWVARKLSESSIALDAAEQLAKRAIAAAEQATEPDSSMRDAPLLDRQGRLAVFMGRAQDVLGWILLKKGDSRGAIQLLSQSVESYPPSAERKGALWHLGVAMEEAGDEPRALDFYIAGFQPDLPNSASRRKRIEALYKKVKGSTDGLDQRLTPP